MIVPLAGALLLLAALLWWLAGRSQRATGLPPTLVRYDDAAARPVAKALVSHRYRLTGRPDYLLEARGTLIPVEVKPTRRATTPYQSDLMQLAAYCLLVEEEFEQRPPYGLLRYADRTWRVPWDDARRAALLATLRAMEEAALGSVARQHHEPARCANCSQRAHCEQRLV